MFSQGKLPFIMRLCRIEKPNFISGTVIIMPCFLLIYFFRSVIWLSKQLRPFYNVWQKSDAENPIKTGITPVDFVVGKTRYGRAWNVGFNIGKAAFVIKQSFEELQKKK